MARGRGRTFKVGRSAKTGKFMKVSTARRRRATAVVETMKERGAR